jgi:hypothetical protein
MIYIRKNNLNKIALELSNLLPSTPSNTFLFEFVYEGNQNRYSRFFYTPDISVYQNRYNLFDIDENFLGATGTTAFNPIQLEPGQYYYNVYSSTFSVDFNDLSPFTSSILSTGRMVVAGTISGTFSNPVYDYLIIDPYTQSVYF